MKATIERAPRSAPRFIVLEGADGAGKTTIRRHLHDALLARGRRPLSIVGTSWLDLKSTEIITQARYNRVVHSPTKITDAYVTDRQLLCDCIIRPQLSVRDVICDRYLYSDVVYNELHFAIPPADTISAYRRSRLLRPDLIVYLDVPIDVALARFAQRAKPTNQWETTAAQETIHQRFHDLLRTDPMAWRTPLHLVDAAKSLDAVMSAALDCVDGVASN